MRGRKPKPTHLKLVDGNAGRRPINDQEPEARGELPAAPPHWMTESQKELYQWGRATAPEGLLKDIDAPIFCEWVCHYDLFVQAQIDISKYGTYVKINTQTVPNPAIGMRNTQSKHAHRCQIEMGWTPSSRSRVKIDGPGKGAKANPFSQLKTFGEDED